MKFFDFLESAYAEKNIQVQESYTAFGHAETQALADLTNGQRRFFKFIAYFKVFFKYFAILLGMKAPLKDAKEIIKEMTERKAAEHKAKLEAAKEQAKLTVVEPTLN